MSSGSVAATADCRAGGIGLRCAAEVSNEEPWGAHRLGKRRVCNLSGPGEMEVLEAWRCSRDRRVRPDGGLSEVCEDCIFNDEEVPERSGGECPGLERPRRWTELRAPTETADRQRSRESWEPSDRACRQTETGRRPARVVGTPCEAARGSEFKSSVTQ